MEKERQQLEYRGLISVIVMASVIGVAYGTVFSRAACGQERSQKQLAFVQAHSSDAALKLFREGRDLIDERKWAGAATRFSEFIRVYPRDKSNAAALYWLAFCLKHQGMSKEADRFLVRLVRDYPKSSWVDDARVMRAELARDLGDNGTRSEGSSPSAAAPKQEPLDQDAESLDRRRQDVARRFRALGGSLEQKRQAIDRYVEMKRRAADESVEMKRRAAEKAVEMKRRAADHSADMKRRAGETKRVALVARRKTQEADRKSIEAARKTAPLGPRPAMKVRRQLEGPEAEELISLQTLFQSDPERATSQAVALLKGRPPVREAALSLIAHHAGERAWPILVDVARDNSMDESLRQQAIYWITRQQGDRVLPALIQLYDSEQSDRMRECLLVSLARSDGSAARAKLLEIARTDKSSHERDIAIRWIGQRLDPEGITALCRLYDDQQEEFLRERILSLLARSKGDEAEAKLTEIARSERSIQLRERAVNVITQRRSDLPTGALVKLYDDQTDEHLKEKILERLDSRGGNEALQKLFSVAKEDPSPYLRQRALECLTRSKDPEAIKLLEQVKK